MAREQVGTEAEVEETPTEGAADFDTLLDEVDAIEPDAPPVEEEASPAEGETPATTPAPDGTATEGEPEPTDSPAPDATASDTDAPPPEATETPETTEEPEPVWTFRVDGRDVAIQGAREDGENIVIPKQAWHTQVKNFLADRAQVNRALQDAHNRLQQAEQRKTLEAEQAQAVLAELDRIMSAAGQDPATSFAEFEKLAQGYEARKAAAERDYWKQQATGLQQTGEQEERERQMASFRPVLHRSLQEWTATALDRARAEGQLDGASDEDLRELAHRIYGMLVEDADAGRVFFDSGELVPGTLLPKLNVNFQRVAEVAGREIGVARRTLERLAAARKAAAKVEAAAKANAEAEAKRKGKQAPPGASPKRQAAGSATSGAPASWDDVLAEVDQL